MFENMKGTFQQFQMMQKLMQNPDFKAFIAHPKTQELFKDPEFKDVAKTRDFAVILANPSFASLMRDPEIAALVSRLDLKKMAVHG